MKQTFNTGNYDKINTLVKVYLPKTLDYVRNTFLPKVNVCLESMLGRKDSFEKDSIDVVFETEKEINLCFRICYIVPDFKIKEIEEEAVTGDEKAISDYLSEDNVKVTIDTEKGLLTLYFKENPEELNNRLLKEEEV